MIWAVLGGLTLIASFASAGYSIYDIVSTGAYKNWSIGDWLFNIALMLGALIPIFKVVKGVGLSSAVVGGGLMKLLAKLPLIGILVKFLHQHVVLTKFMAAVWGLRLFAKDGYLFKFGEVVGSLGRAVVKHPWLLAALVFSSTIFDGLLKRIFQLWGDLSLRAATFVYDRVGEIMSDKGYADPITQTVAIIDDSRSLLPPCFTAIWGAVGASECIGLIITTFQYLFLLSALVKGYKVFGK